MVPRRSCDDRMPDSSTVESARLARARERLGFDRWLPSLYFKVKTKSWTVPLAFKARSLTGPCQLVLFFIIRFVNKLNFNLVFFVTYVCWKCLFHNSRPDRFFLFAVRSCIKKNCWLDKTCLFDWCKKSEHSVAIHEPFPNKFECSFFIGSHYFALVFCGYKLKV